MMTLWEVAEEILRRLTSVFLRDSDGRRPVYGRIEVFQRGAETTPTRPRERGLTARDHMKSPSPPAPGRVAELLWLAIVLLVAMGCAWRPAQSIDLRVYYDTGRSFFGHSGPMYGPTSGMGYPLVYRYPPLFLCLFRPLALLPLRTAIALWAALKVVALGLVIRGWYKRFAAGHLIYAFLISALLLVSYLVQDLRLGNVQLLVVELVCAALLLCDDRPLLGSVLLGLAAVIKLWPLFFLPYLALRARWRFAAQALLATGVLTVAPSLWLGWNRTFHLLAEWLSQERRLNVAGGDLWFWYPSQSLHGVMLRYLTVIDYSRVPDRHYRLINFASMAPTRLEELWVLLAVALFLFSLVWTYRCADEASAYSIAFCFLLIIEPNVHRVVYVTLLWPALQAGIVVNNRAAPPLARRILLVAVAFAVLVPLVPGSASQRLAQVLGVDFFAVLIPLTVGLLICSKSVYSGVGAVKGHGNLREPGAASGALQAFIADP